MLATKSDKLIDELTSIITNHMYTSQLIKIKSNSINVYFKKNYASLLSSQNYLQDLSEIKLDSDFCALLDIHSTFLCANKVITQRVI